MLVSNKQRNNRFNSHFPGLPGQQWLTWVSQLAITSFGRSFTGQYLPIASLMCSYTSKNMKKYKNQTRQNTTHVRCHTQLGNSPPNNYFRCSTSWKNLLPLRQAQRSPSLTCTYTRRQKQHEAMSWHIRVETAPVQVWRSWTTWTAGETAWTQWWQPECVCQSSRQSAASSTPCEPFAYTVHIEQYIKRISHTMYTSTAIRIHYSLCRTTEVSQSNAWHTRPHPRHLLVNWHSLAVATQHWFTAFFVQVVLILSHINRHSLPVPMALTVSSR